MVDEVRRRRVRRPSLRVDHDEIAARVKELYETGLTHVEAAKEARIQRYAKLRMWMEDTDFPWDGASNVALPIMAEKSQRTQDTLNNAVMAHRPAIQSKAVTPGDEQKQTIIDGLLDFQFFEDQDGETVVSELAEMFVDDGVAVAFVPWVTEKAKQLLTPTWEPIPDDSPPDLYFRSILTQVFNAEPDDGVATFEQVGRKDGWDWKVILPETDEDEKPRTVNVSFYTRSEDDRIEIRYETIRTVYDGPLVIPKDFEEVLAPPRAKNLQAPGPSNPGGAAWVVLVDRPTVGEIAGLAKRGIYDLVTTEDLAKMRTAGSRAGEDQPRETLKDDLGGLSDGDARPKDSLHRRVTRLMCFDTFDLDGDGIGEQVIWWVILESETLCRARRLSEVYPGVPPIRPLAEASFIPVIGRRVGMSLSEMTEGLQDVMKQILDQVINAGDIQNTPFGFYRPQGAMQPETISLAPGELYPLGDPQRDVFLPTLNNQAVGFGVNMFSLMQTMLDRLTMIGDVELGRVPAGRSSALRTASGIAQLTAKGEARPERILRRFFKMLTQIWAIMHRHNQHFLTRNKQIRIVGVHRADEDPYLTIEDKMDITATVKFTFKPAVFNRDAQQIAEGMQSLLSAYASPLAIQLGIVDQDGLYGLLRDFGRVVMGEMPIGGDPDDYLKPPLSTSLAPKVSAEEAVTAMLQNRAPFGVPKEAGGWIEHLQKLINFTESEDFGLMTPAQIDAFFTPWVQQAAAAAEAQQQQQALLEQAAADSEGQMSGGQQRQNGGRPSQGVGEAQASNQSAPPISGANEQINEGDRGNI